MQFRKSLLIDERLTALDPDNAGWQLDLSASYGRIGDMLESEGNLAGALEEFRKSLAITERLAVLDPTNAGWQRELSARYNRVGGILESLGNLAEALEEFRKALAIRESLAAQDPDNAGWLRDRALSCCLVGYACSRLGNAEDAEAALRVAVEHFASVQTEEDAGSLVDLSLALALTADHEERAGRLEKAEVLDAELVSGRWQPNGITGAFQKKLMPVVNERLAKAFNAVDLPAKAEIAARVRDAVESAVAIDTAIWDALLSEALAASPPEQPAAVVLRETLERLRGAEETQH
jgi:tetratricopeptide (TPR) repeat protein